MGVLEEGENGDEERGIVDLGAANEDLDLRGLGLDFSFVFSGDGSKSEAGDTAEDSYSSAAAATRQRNLREDSRARTESDIILVVKDIVVLI